MNIYISTENKQILGQRMYTSLNLLQMGTTELEEYMQQLSMENPFLEVQTRQDERNILSRNVGKRYTQYGTKAEMPIPDKAYNTLKASLEEQLLTLRLEARLNKAIRLLILNLDDRGYLPESICNSRAWLSDPALFEAALKLLQGLEPIGVGARSLSECLLLQLDAKGEKNSLAYEICKEYLEHLGLNHINLISKALGASRKDIQAAREIIAGLNPLPSNGFDDGRCSICVKPDIEIELLDGELVVKCFEDYSKSCSINSFYAEMLKHEDLSAEDRQYFSEKIEQARDAIRSIKHRNSTMLECARVIADEQWDFFAYGTGHIRPCTANSIASILNIHPTTVTRAVKNKYIYCTWGLFPMSHFFMQDISGVTAEVITEQIKAIIRKEDPEHPISDSSICRELERRGFDVARRTIAKYRDLAGIPPACGRKKA